MIEKTRRLLFLSSAVQVPFIALNLMLDVILSSHFGASALQISILTTLRPVLAVLAFYWGSLLLFRPELLRFSLVAATAMATLFFLFSPFANSIWYFIFAECCYVLFLRAANPAQMEILKQNLSSGNRERIFSQYLSLCRALAIVIGPLLGLFLLHYPEAWKELFSLTALLYITSSGFKARLYDPAQQREKEEGRAVFKWKEFLLQPWRASWQLLRENRAFLQFQIGFFIGGAGLMFAKPAIPGFLTKTELSFLEIFSLFTLLEGLGFILTSSFWARFLEKQGLHRTSYFVVLCFSLQPLLLIFGTPPAIFAAYFFYGAAQAGSNLAWNLSGALLCGKESSSQYTSVNILAIGLRGCFVPLLGAGCTVLFGVESTLVVSMCCMFVSAAYLWRTAVRTYPERLVKN